MKHLTSVLVIIAAVTLAGCSNHNRTSDSPFSPVDVQNMLQEVEGAQAASGGGDISAALTLKNEPGAVVYIAQAPTQSLKLINILSFLDLSFLGSAPDWNSITDARVLFIDLPDHRCSLIIGIKAGDAYSYFAFSGSGTISNSEFSASLTGSSNIIVQSYDVNSGDLSTVIQLKIFDSEGNYVGKVSTLDGFTL